MVYAGKLTVTTAGTPQPLSTTRAPACWVKIQCSAGNSGNNAYVVGPGIVDALNSNSTITKSGGITLAKSADTTTFLQLGDSSAVNYYDLNKIYIDVDTGGDSVTYLYGRR